MEVARDGLQEVNIHTDSCVADRWTTVTSHLSVNSGRTEGDSKMGGGCGADCTVLQMRL